MTNFGKFWTNDKVDRLTDMLKEQKTYTDIAISFDTTRNSVAGAVNRYVVRGKSLPPVPSLSGEKVPPRKKGGALSINFTKRYAKLPSERRIKHQPSSFPPAYGHCLNIIGEPKNLMCCGLPAFRNSSWCEDHYRLYLVPSIRRTR